MAFNSFFANPPANSSNVNPNTGGLFGLSPNANTTQSNTTTPSLLGNTNPAQAPNPLPNTNANSNANSNANTGGIFGLGANTNTGGLFGLSSNTTTTQSNTTTPSLFGNTNPTQASNPPPNNANTNTGSIFGPAANTNTGQSLFGLSSNTNTTQSNTTTPSLFGNTNPAQAPNPPPPNNPGSIFGPSSNTNTGGLFGLSSNTNTTQSNTTTPSLFGNANPAQAPNILPNNTNTNANAGSIFGLSANTNTNTGNQQQQGTSGTGTTGNLLSTNQLGQQPQQQPLSNLFNSTSRPNTLTSTTGVGSGMTQLEAHEQFLKVSQGVETIYQAWNSATKNCRFQYIFYNLVDPKQVNMYGRPPNATNDALWEKAVRENPDPSCLVPVIAIGFDDLRERANAQSTQSSLHLQKLTDLSNRLKSLLTEHSISNASRLQRAHNAQTQLTQRLMRLVQHLHLLIPAVRSSSIRVEEEELRGKLEEMEEELKRSRVKGKLNEMWALLGAVGAFMERGRGDGQGGQGEWAVVDDEGLAQITQILAEQQAGLQHLTKILQKDQKDLAIIMGSGTAGGDDGYPANEGENFWRSTTKNTSLRSTLR